MKRLSLLIFFVLIAIGCNAINTMREGANHSQEVADDLGKAIGTKPFVGFNWTNGSLTNVTVTFDRVPAGKTTEEIAALARDSISARFKEEPQNITISFVFSGKSPGTKH